MKLWLDDIRRPPDESWTWARTAEEARLLVQSHPIEEMSLDHDMGLHAHDPDELDADLRIGHSDDDGFEFVRWLCQHGTIPERVTIHSWNPVGARRMADWLADHGRSATVQPCVAQRDAK